MQSLYASCMVEAKTVASGCFHVNVEEKLGVQLSDFFYSFPSNITEEKLGV